MKLEINLPKDTVKELYDLLVEKLDDTCSQRQEAIEKIHDCHPNMIDHWMKLIQGYGEDYVILDIVTDILAEELKKEGAL
jgi:hypothetical protein